MGNDTQYTEGPWATSSGTFYAGPKPHATVVSQGDSGKRLTVAGMYPCDEEIANARLIAAAPDMLAALEKLSRLGNGDRPGNSEGNVIAQAAIAKATGVTS